MADSLQFKTAARRAEPIEFVLDDEAYTFIPPKTALMLMPGVFASGADAGMAMTRATFDWLSAGLPEDQNDRLIARLRDPEDDFDIDNLTEIISALTEQTTGRPTT